jgi:hypothetical protein
VALPDLGADDNLVPRYLLRALDAQGILVPTLSTPIRVKLAVQVPDVPITVKQQALLTVEFQQAARPLRLRNLCSQVAEQHMEEVLIGRPLLNELGIDAPAHLEAHRVDYPDVDVVFGRCTRTTGHCGYDTRVAHLQSWLMTKARSSGDIFSFA